MVRLMEATVRRLPWEPRENIPRDGLGWVDSLLLVKWAWLFILSL